MADIVDWPFKVHPKVSDEVSDEVSEGHLRIVPITPSGEEPDLSALLAACEAKILELGVELQARDEARVVVERRLAIWEQQLAAQIVRTNNAVAAQQARFTVGWTVGIAIMNYLLGVVLGVAGLYLAGWRKV